MAVVLGVTVASCQSTKGIAHFPAVREYGPRSTAPLLVASAEQAEPVLPAAVSNEAPAAQTIDRPQAPVPTMAEIKPLEAPADTLKKVLLPTPSSKPDPATTGVNVVGGVLTAGGLAVVIASANADTGGEWPGLAKAMGGFLGLMLMIAGVALLFFQGKNGRLRRLREERRAARRALISPTAAPEATSDAPTEEKTATKSIGQRSKVGLSLIIAAGILLLLSLLPVGLFFISLPIAFILLLVGVILMLAG
ncbi:hypothetical protein BXP70_18560 [Hymenobacter crusticola]|uniref:Uncharacterized protein n=2 Tax=Hymenobacter crusticola TaxID=1770526 RepID=A0A243WA80_9BACT|nr:hypothetical protein BXP70_18560 [Hymenobacter crusticola]